MLTDIYKWTCIVFRICNECHEPFWFKLVMKYMHNTLCICAFPVAPHIMHRLVMPGICIYMSWLAKVWSAMAPQFSYKKGTVREETSIPISKCLQAVSLKIIVWQSLNYLTRLYFTW